MLLTRNRFGTAVTIIYISLSRHEASRHFARLAKMTSPIELRYFTLENGVASASIISG